MNLSYDKSLMRFALAGCLLVLPVAAMANGAMGLGLEIFDLRYWAAYVVAMVGAEAWLIGRAIGISWPKSLLTSLVANLLTAMLCGMGCFAPFLHTQGEEANPLFQSVVVLAFFAIPSALFESIAWGYAKGQGLNADPPTWKRAIAVHLALVPVGLAVLLIPERPYRGIEILSVAPRRRAMLTVAKSVDAYVEKKGKMPDAMSPEALLSELREANVEVHAKAHLAFEVPRYPRFSTGQMLPVRWQFNPAVVGRKLQLGAEKLETWYLRPDLRAGNPRWGLMIDVWRGEVKQTMVPAQLGYPKDDWFR